jgi:hypothetical protein
MYKFLSLFLFVLVIINSTIGQDTCKNITFQKAFQISKYSAPWEVIQTKDGGYLLTGTQSDEPTGNGDGLLLKTNKYGEKQWIKGMNRTEADYLTSSSTQLPDSGYISTVQVFAGTEGLQKTDKNGNIIWQKSFNDPTRHLAFQKVLANPDGSFIVIGNVSESTFSGGNIIIKFDEGGNIIWQKIFTSVDHRNYPVDLFTKGDTLFVTGTIPSDVVYVADTAYIMKMAISDGAVYAAKKFWLQNNWIAGNTILKRTDNKYAWSINFYDRSSEENYTVLSTLDQNFNLTKSVKLSNLPGGCIDASPSHDNSFVMIYESFIEPVSYFIKFGENLNPLFAKRYSPLYRDNTEYYLTCITATNDSGFVMGGYKYFADSSVTFLFKTDALGNTGSCPVTTVTPPSVKSTSLNSVSFVWQTIINADLLQGVYDLPAVEPNNSETIFCSNSTCDKPCTIYAPNGKIYLCHVPPGNTGSPQQLMLPLSAVNWHISNHPEDKVGLCGQPCSNFIVQSNNQNNSTMEVLSTRSAHASIYPNPTINSFTVRLNETASKPLSLNVFSLEGKIVYTLEKPASLREINFGNSLVPGIYFVEIRFSDKKEVFKIIKLN